MAKSEPTYKGYIKPLSLMNMAHRIAVREDNKLDYRRILKTLTFFFEEMDKALLNGEKVMLGEVGTLTPSVHTPKTDNTLLVGEGESERKPHTTVNFRRKHKFKDRMNAHFLRNLRTGYPGLGVKCMCTVTQKGILTEKGYLKPKEEGITCLDE